MSENQTDYDVIVIGAGPAGYVAAIRSAQLGLKTACIDNWTNTKGKPSLGGTYINAGCIPSISLLESSRIYHLLNHDINQHGINIKDLSVDMSQMIQHKNVTVEQLSQQITDLFQHNNISSIHAQARLLDAGKVEIQAIDSGDFSEITAKHIILAGGSTPIELPCAPIDNQLIIDSKDALNMEEIPKKLGIIGAGIIGLELAGIWNRLGSEVILLEAQEAFMTHADQQIAEEAYRLYEEQGLDIHLGTRVISTQLEQQQVRVNYQDAEGEHSIYLDKLIVASGRKPNSENLATPEIELLLDESGFVHVNEECLTTLPNVYAIGDLTLSGPMLAHKGLEEGVFVAELIAEQQKDINYDIIPNVIYTEPEIAWVGKNEQALRAAGQDITIGTFPFKANSRAQVMGKTEGLIKIITSADNDIILGVHIIGVNASELIAEAALAMEFSASGEDLARTIHAHPTISEVLYEAALALENRSLHCPDALINS